MATAKKTIIQCISPYDGIIFATDDPSVIMDGSSIYILEKGYFSIPVPFDVKSKVYLPLSSIIKVLRSKKGSVKVERGRLVITVEEANIKKAITVPASPTDRDVSVPERLLNMGGDISPNAIKEMAEMDSVIRSVSKLSRDTFCGVTKFKKKSYFVMGDMRHAWIKELQNDPCPESMNVNPGLYENLYTDECTLKMEIEVSKTGERRNMCYAESAKYGYKAGFPIPIMEVSPDKILEIFSKVDQLTDCAWFTVTAELFSKAMNEIVEHLRKTKGREVTISIADGLMTVSSGSLSNKANVEIPCTHSEGITLTIENPEKKALNRLGNMFGDFEITIQIAKSNKIAFLLSAYVSLLFVYSSATFIEKEEN